MTAFALALVLGSALMHATWNLVAKRVQAETPFLFLVYVVGALAYTPFAIAVIVIAQPRLGLPALVFVAMAIVLQTVYFATLTAGYRAGDLSLVYPIARATGPLLFIPPIVYDWMTIGGQALVVAPTAWRRRAEVANVWKTQRRAVVVVGLLSRLSYLLMLTALAISPVSYVAPARESGILFGTLLGVRVLSEGQLQRRALGAGAMVMGIVLLALG